MSDLQIGILIIGSLIWDPKKHRSSWRADRLIEESAIRVLSPIRYGRMSQSRQNTYTMVFSNALVPADLGHALVVPCRNAVSTAAQLFAEAQHLWAAEQPGSAVLGPISAQWGAVGASFNPGRHDLAALKTNWSSLIQRDGRHYQSFKHAEEETPAVAPDGILSIPWPTLANDEPIGLDIVLATATQPSLSGGLYPTADLIANAWARARSELNYFEENRRVGITTADDEEILRILATH